MGVGLADADEFDVGLVEDDEIASRRSARREELRRTPYVAVHRVDADRVVILRVPHGAGRWPPAD